MRALPLLSLVVAPALTSMVQAQQAPAAANAAIAVGIVYDSVRSRPMSGARVRVDSSELVTTADENGKFRIDGIPPGEHFLRVEAPMVDTLGILLRTAAEPFAAGETKAVELTTPAPETLIGILCSAAWRARGPAALMGRVREADSGAPATGAKVSLVWYEIDVSAGIKKVPRVREATVGSDGSFRICGLPPNIDGKVQVLRGPLTSGDIPISFGDDPLALRSMSIAAPMVAAARDSGAPATSVALGSARLTGRVVTKDGRPLGGARVQLEGTSRAATTRPTGEFVLDSLPSGTQTVSVRLLGYSPVEKAVDLTSRAPASVSVTLENFVPVLAEVRVTAQRERALDDVGYSRRKRMGMGWYLDGKEMDSHGTSTNFSDVMRIAPGIRVSTAQGNRQVIQSSRDPVNGCVNIYIDGSLWQQMEPGDVDDFVKPFELGAVEVYNGSGTPAEYQPAGKSSCTTIVAWTKRRLDRKR